MSYHNDEGTNTSQVPKFMMSVLKNHEKLARETRTNLEASILMRDCPTVLAQLRQRA